MSMTKLNAGAEVMLKEEKAPKRRTMRDSKHFEPLMLAFICFGYATFCTVYIMYYMKVFLDVYHISTGWIKIVQTLFLVWNAVNDPMMGYLQDIGCCGMTWIMDRRKVILYSAPVFAFSYMIFWFPWSTTNTFITGLHLLISLFMFDTIFTLVLSAYCGLLVEACSKHTQRVRCLVYAELCLVLGGSIIFPLNVFSNEAKDFGRFQIGCFLIAVLGFAAMTVGTYSLNSPKPKKEHELQEEIELGSREDLNVSTMEPESSFRKAARVSWQIIRQPRFLCLIGSQFMRTMRITFATTWQMILVAALVSRPGFLEGGSPQLSMFYALVQPVGSVLFLFLWKPLSLLGTHKMMLILLGVALVNVTVALFVGRSNPIFVIVFLGMEIICATSGGRSFGLLLTGETIDTDTKVHKRSSPLSTLIFTLRALFTKPAEQLSPIIFVTLLDMGGFTKYRHVCIPEARKNNASFGNSTLADVSTTTMRPMLPLDDPACVTLFDTMYSSMLYFTLFCTIAETVIICIDYWYKRRVLREEDAKTNPMEMPMNEEEFMVKKQTQH